jgi:2-amino-4-hydroxy-6-hydroxymethyldihydropteridine diphosphokinase
MREPEHVHLSLGSNIGDRARYLRSALDALSAVDGVTLVRTSSLYETAPVGKIEQPVFLNLAAEIETVLQPLELLNAIKEIEHRLGRRPSERWGPREIDIDIILWGCRAMDTEPLTVPHREFRTRAFVLKPLAEIAPQAVDPITGKTVAELVARPEAQGDVVRLDV